MTAIGNRKIIKVLRKVYSKDVGGDFLKDLETDLSIFEEFDFEKPPVGVKFLHTKPEEIEQIDKELPACEMIAEAQKRDDPFYFGKENENCVGSVALGMEEMPPFAEAGLIGDASDEGPTHNIFEEARANARIYEHIPKFSKGTVNYVAMSKLENLTFEPDILAVTAETSQAEIILRAMSYSTGELWDPKLTNVLGCSWMFVYPYKTGKVNYMTTGLAFGAKAKEIFEEGQTLIFIPWDWFSTITENLEEMEWELPSYKESREEFLEREERMMKYLMEKET